MFIVPARSETNSRSEELDEGELEQKIDEAYESFTDVVFEHHYEQWLDELFPPVIDVDHTSFRAKSSVLHFILGPEVPLCAKLSGNARRDHMTQVHSSPNVYVDTKVWKRFIELYNQIEKEPMPFDIHTYKTALNLDCFGKMAKGTLMRFLNMAQVEYIHVVSYGTKCDISLFPIDWNLPVLFRNLEENSTITVDLAMTVSNEFDIPTIMCPENLPCESQNVFWLCQTGEFASKTLWYKRDVPQQSEDLLCFHKFKAYHNMHHVFLKQLGAQRREHAFVSENISNKVVRGYIQRVYSWLQMLGGTEPEAEVLRRHGSGVRIELTFELSEPKDLARAKATILTQRTFVKNKLLNGGMSFEQFIENVEQWLCLFGTFSIGRDTKNARLLMRQCCQVISNALGHAEKRAIKTFTQEWRREIIEAAQNMDHDSVVEVRNEPENELDISNSESYSSFTPLHLYPEDAQRSSTNGSRASFTPLELHTGNQSFSSLASQMSFTPLGMEPMQCQSSSASSTSFTPMEMPYNESNSLNTSKKWPAGITALQKRLAVDSNSMTTSMKRYIRENRDETKMCDPKLIVDPTTLGNQASVRLHEALHGKIQSFNCDLEDEIARHCMFYYNGRSLATKKRDDGTYPSNHPLPGVGLQVRSGCTPVALGTQRKGFDSTDVRNVIKRVAELYGLNWRRHVNHVKQPRSLSSQLPESNARRGVLLRQGSIVKFCTTRHQS